MNTRLKICPVFTKPFYLMKDILSSAVRLQQKISCVREGQIAVCGLVSTRPLLTITGR